MTTIAYNHKDKEIAVDSRYTRGDTISNNNGVKYRKVNGVTFVIAGNTMYYDDIINCYFGNEECAKGVNVSALVIDNGVAYECAFDQDGGFWKDKLTENTTHGCGSVWATAAMDFGCSAKDAVKYAMTRDIYTGGKVHVFKVE